LLTKFYQIVKITMIKCINQLFMVSPSIKIKKIQKYQRKMIIWLRNKSFKSWIMGLFHCSSFREEMDCGQRVQKIKFWSHLLVWVREVWFWIAYLSGRNNDFKLLWFERLVMHINKLLLEVQTRTFKNYSYIFFYFSTKIISYLQPGS
jgi:hypothetical protein